MFLYTAHSFSFLLFSLAMFIISRGHSCLINGFFYHTVTLHQYWKEKEGTNGQGKLSDGYFLSFFRHIYFKSIDFPQLFPVVVCALQGYLIEWNPKHENRKVFIPKGNKTYFQVMWGGKKKTKTVKILIIIYEIYPLGHR